MSQSLWQHPYVNVFKHCDVGGQWKKSSRHGDVTTVMDKSIKATVWRISGSIPANNFILCPRTGSQSLGLTGRYFYLLFKPVVGKYFSVHLDIAADEQLAIRLSFSNLFKEFKATSTWLQFPFSSASPQCQWTFLVIDLHYTLNMYVKRQYLYVKSIKLCSNMLVKNVFTSDILFDPTLTQSARHRLMYEKLLEKGMMPVPREMAFLVAKGGDWTELYDLVTFPESEEAHKMIARSVGTVAELQEMTARQEGKQLTLVGSSGQHEQSTEATGRHNEMGDRDRKVRGPASHSVRQKQTYKQSSDIDRVLTKPEEKSNGEVVSSDNREVHIYSERPDNVAVHYDDSDESESTESDIESVDARVSEITRQKRPFKTLQPDPILQLSHVIGFGGKTYNHVLWTFDGESIVYPCHNLVVCMNVFSRKQDFFIGHTDKVCSIAFNASTSLLASCQCSSPPVVRLWQFSSRHCLTMLNVSVSLVHSLSLSHSGRVLAAGGRDRHGKQVVLVWSISSVKDQTLTGPKKQRNRVPETQLIAKAHTDVNMTRLRISGFDDTRMVSCGHSNVRLWRVKERSLRSCPVNTGEYHGIHFTDAVFDEAIRPDGRDERRVFASSACGKVFIINYTQIQVLRVVQLESGGINCLAVSELFCAIGSMSSLKLWKLDFSSVFLETEQEGNVEAVGISQDGLKVLLASDQGCIGMLDATSRSYSTLMRSHTDTIFSVSLHERKRHVTTVSADNTIRVWDCGQQFTQLFDFCAPHDCPCCVAYHPVRNCLACGFASGAVRIFHVSSTRLLAEHRHHSDYVTGLAFTSDGSYLLSSAVDSLLVLYDSSQQSCPIIRALANTVARLKELSPRAIALNRRGTRAAFVGPSEFAVTVVEAHTLNEVLRLDISSALCGLESERVALDIATRVCYSSEVVGQLLVATRNCRLLRFDAETGQIISEVCNVHRSKVSGVTVSTDGRLLVTSGDKLIKVWDYQMKLDLNFQVSYLSVCLSLICVGLLNILHRCSLVTPVTSISCYSLHSQKNLLVLVMLSLYGTYCRTCLHK
jgi:WD40 repeat protein